MFHLSTQNMIKAFKFRAQAIFNLLEKTHTPAWFTQFKFEKFFPFLYIISTQGSYIHQNLDTNRCFANLRAISNLCSFLYTLYINKKRVCHNIIYKSVQIVRKSSIRINVTFNLLLKSCK